MSSARRTGGIGVVLLVLLAIFLAPVLVLVLVGLLFVPFMGGIGGGSEGCAPTAGVLPPSLISQPLNGYITEAAAEWNVDPLALAVLVHNEHGWTFDVQMPPPYGNGPVPVTSFAGAQGFMQQLLPTFERLKNANPAHQPGDINDAVDTLYVAAQYLYEEGGVVGAPLGTPATVFQEGTQLNAIVAYHSGPGFEANGLGPAGRQYRDEGYAAYLELLQAGGASENPEFLCSQTLSQDGTIPGILGEDAWVLPIETGRFRVTDPFGVVKWYRNYIPHRGTDLAAPEGTPIRATRSGVVKFSGYNPRTPYFGYHVIIDHGIVDGKHVITRYHVIGALMPDLQGKFVNAGEKIGTVGMTLGNTTGNHVHFEVQVDGEFVNPARYFSELR